MGGVADLHTLASKVTGWAAPGEDVEAYAVRSRTTTVRAYQGDVESLSSAESAGIGVRVVVGGRQGFAWAGTLDPDVLVETLAEARDNARFAEPDDFVGLARADGVPPPPLVLVDPALAGVGTERKIALAIELERLTRARDPRVSVEQATFSDSIGEAAVVTSTGISALSEGTYCVAAVSSLAEEGGETQTGSGVSFGRGLDDLDLAAAAADASDRALRLLGSRQPESQRLTIVLDPKVTASLLEIIGSTLSGEAVLKGRSLFAGRLGEAVAAPVLTFIDDPTDPAALGAELYDGEGLAKRRNLLIEGGRLERFLYNTYAGRRAGVASTGSAERSYASTPSVGASALTLMPGTATQAELLAEVGEGLYVQSVSGLHSGVNPISGDFSVGATGLMIRGGALAEPVREATIASTLQRMLLDVVAVGADHQWLPGGAAGVTLVIRDVSLGGS